MQACRQNLGMQPDSLTGPQPAGFIRPSRLYLILVLFPHHYIMTVETGSFSPMLWSWKGLMWFW